MKKGRKNMMYLNRKTVILVTIAEVVSVLAALGAGYYFGNSRGYTKGCQHSFFLLAAYNNPVEVATKDLEETCELLESRQDQAQDLLDQAKALTE